MKEPIDYLGHINSLTTREELYNIGKQMQIDAYNEAINDAINNVELNDFAYEFLQEGANEAISFYSLTKLLKS